MTAGGAPVAVVMVGGRGERLRPLTDNVPKPLLEIGGEPIVERILRRLASAGIHDVWLTVNYLAHTFEDVIGDGARLGLRVRYVHEQEPLGTAGALGLLPREHVTGPIVVTNGDLVTDIDFADLIDHHVHQNAGVTVCGIEHDTQVLYGVLETGGANQDELRGIEEKPFRTDLVNAGMYVVEPDLLDLVPVGQPSGMPDLIERALDGPRPVGVYRIKGHWFDIGSHDEFHRVSRIFDTSENAAHAADTTEES